VKSEILCFVPITIVTIIISITYKNYYPTNYTKYQQYLYDRVKGYKEQTVSVIGYRKISKIFNSEGLKTPMGKTFKPNHVFSIYKKGKVREERLNSEVKVERTLKVTRYQDKNLETKI